MQILNETPQNSYASRCSYSDSLYRRTEKLILGQKIVCTHRVTENKSCIISIFVKNTIRNWKTFCQDFLRSLSTSSKSSEYSDYINALIFHLCNPFNYFRYFVQPPYLRSISRSSTFWTQYSLLSFKLLSNAFHELSDLWRYCMNY